MSRRRSTQPSPVVAWRSMSGYNGSTVYYARSCGNTLNVTAYAVVVIAAEVNRTVGGHREVFAARRWERYADREVCLSNAKAWCETQAKRHASR